MAGERHRKQQSQIDNQLGPFFERGSFAACQPYAQQGQSQARQPDQSQARFSQDVPHLRLPGKRQFSTGRLTGL